MSPAAKCSGRSTASSVIARRPPAAVAVQANSPDRNSRIPAALAAVYRRVRLLMKAGLALLLLAEGPALAETASQKLLVRLRAVVQQYDKIAFRPPASLAADTVELRGKFRELLVEASALAPESQPFREMAEIFVFSGGNSAALRPFEKGLEPGSTEAKLFEGVLAYAEGRKAEAGTKLAAVDATRLNPMQAT